MSPGGLVSVRSLLAALAGALVALSVVAFLAYRHLPSVRFQDLRFTVSSDPLPPAEAQGRTQARLLAERMADQVQLAADSIRAQTNDDAIAAAALRWKLGTLDAATAAGLQPAAQLALVDLWLLGRQMAGFTGSQAGRAAFGAVGQPIAHHAASALARDAEALAARHLDAQALSHSRRLVDEQLSAHPITDASMARTSIALAWLSMAPQVGGLPHGPGSLSDIASQGLGLADLRLRQLARAVYWRGELSVVENRKRLELAAAAVDEAIKQARAEGGGDLKPAAIAEGAQRLVRTLGWPWMTQIGAVAADLLKWLGLLALCVGGLGFGLGWWLARRGRT